MTLKNIHIYMMTNLDILTKKFILFPLNEGNSYWNGWTAVNPWVQLARVLYEWARPSKETRKSLYFVHLVFVYYQYNSVLLNLYTCFCGHQTKVYTWQYKVVHGS